jgi:Undecaprenyl-phosphate galactose phosphotransferase WbaP
MEDLNMQRSSAEQSTNLVRDSAIGDHVENHTVTSVHRRSDWIQQADVPTPSLRALFAKRTFDIVGALTIAIVFMPVIIAVAIAIRFSSQPVVFSHQRVGRDRKMFQCYKFRSMIPDAEEVLQRLIHSNPEILREWRENHKLRDDPRITKFGDFLRRSSLDELPQLWNVLRGDMSLVGPRPVVEDELERYGNQAKMYLSIRPGMTGLWQIMGRSNVTYSRRVSLDSWYVRKNNVLFDAWILMRTAAVVVKKVGAH